MLKVFYTSSENTKNFGVSQVVDTLKNKLKKKSINIKFSNRLIDFIKFKPNIVHIHGCWKIHLLIIFIISKFRNIKVVISPHGMIDPFSISQKKYKKKIAWFLYQKLIFLSSNLIIVNSNKEKKNLKSIIKKNINIRVISHGVNILNNFSIKKKNFKTIKFVYFSRIHHSKNLHNLVKIWCKDYFFHKYSLDIYGSIVDKEYFSKVMEISKSKKNIQYKGSLNKNIQFVLSKYNVFIHPSESENFGLVILEALSSGVFPILNEKLDWKVLDKKGYGKCIKFNQQELKKVIINIEKRKKYFFSIKFRNKQIRFVKKNYNWNNIIINYLREYCTLSNYNSKLNTF